MAWLACQSLPTAAPYPGDWALTWPSNEWRLYTQTHTPAKAHKWCAVMYMCTVTADCWFYSPYAAGKETLTHCFRFHRTAFYLISAVCRAWPERQTETTQSDSQVPLRGKYNHILIADRKCSPVICQDTVIRPPGDENCCTQICTRSNSAQINAHFPICIWYSYLVVLFMSFMSVLMCRYFSSEFL